MISAKQISASAPIVSLRQISKRYPGIVANDGIDLDLYAGEVHALLGENGAGKSTLISILSGMVQPDEGTMEIEGSARRLASPRDALNSGIGTVYQHPTMVSSLTVLENLMLGGAWYSPLKEQATITRFADLCEVLGVTIDASARLGDLSLGQQQMVEIIKALWSDRRVLILDESTAMLTPQGVDDLLNTMDRLRRAGTAILFTTHKLSEAAYFGDRVTVLRGGRRIGGLDKNELQAMTTEQAVNTFVHMMFGSREEESGDSERRVHRDAPGETGAVMLEVTDFTLGGTDFSERPGKIGFSLCAGEILGIAGIEGNGQKELAEILAGQRPLNGGTIVLDGRDVGSLGVRARAAAGLRYVTDDRLGEGTISTFDIASNLLLKRVGDRPFWRKGVSQAKEIVQHARRRIAEYNVYTPSHATPIGRLSGGNIQKVLLARELEGEPKVIVFNKPTHGLDRQNIANAHQAIRAIASRGVGVIVISTDLDELMQLSDRIAVMFRGRVSGVLKNEGQIRLRLGELMTGAGDSTDQATAFRENAA